MYYHSFFVLYCISFLRAMASLISTESFWSDSLTKYTLIVYVEGIVCNNFDKKIIYNVRRHNKYTWCVLKKLAGDEGEPASTNQHF